MTLFELLVLIWLYFSFLVLPPPCFSFLYVRCNCLTLSYFNIINKFNLNFFYRQSVSHSCPERSSLNLIPLGSFSCFFYFCHNMWSTFFVTDEEGRTIGPAAPGGGAAPGGAPQGAGAMSGLMAGRSTFGGNKRRRTTSGHFLSEAQEGKVTGFMLRLMCILAHAGDKCPPSTWSTSAPFSWSAWLFSLCGSSSHVHPLSNELHRN